MSPAGTIALHATSVEIDGHAALIEGPSGSGKSGLALELIGRGARLIADDMTRLGPGPDGTVWAQAPDKLKGVIEARGVGLLYATHVASAPLSLIIDLARIEPDRLPPRRTRTILGQDIDLVWRVDAPHFPAAIIQLMRGGRYA